MSDLQTTTNNSKILIEKILSDPVSFRPARHAESDNLKPSSYVLITNSSKQSSANQTKHLNNNNINNIKKQQNKLSPNRMLSSPKPKSMAEAVAAYTGKKYLTKAEKKMKKKLEKKEKLQQTAEFTSPLVQSKSKILGSLNAIAQNSNDDEDFGEDINANNIDNDNTGEDLATKIVADSQLSSDEDNEQGYALAVDEVVNDDNDHDADNVIDISSSDDREVAKTTRSQIQFKELERAPRVKNEVTKSGIEISEQPKLTESGEHDDKDDEDDEDYELEDEDEDDGDDDDYEEEEDGESEDEKEESKTEKKSILPFVKVDQRNTSIDESEDENAIKKINDKIELKKLANNHDLKGLNQELITIIDRQQGEQKSNALAPEENSNVRSVSPSRSLAATSSDEQDNEFLYGQNLDFNDDHFYQLEEYVNDRGSTNSKRIWKNWRHTFVNSRPVGLLNHGVTCYTNAAVQAMIHIPAVQHYLKDVNDHKYDDIINSRSVTTILANITSRMWKTMEEHKSSGGGARYINPKKLIKRLDDINCMMSEWQQEDSHEYFMSLLSRLQEDSTPKKQKLNTSIIYDIFGGVLNQAVVCQNCNHVSKTKQEFYDLSLSLDPKKKRQIVPSSMSTSRINSKETSPELMSSSPKSESASADVENGNASSTSANSDNNKDFPAPVVKKKPRYSVINAINDFFEPELIKSDRHDQSAGYACSNCKKTTDALKFSSIDRAPETLVIHIKRFRFNENSNSSSKLKSPVSYPLILDLTDFEDENLSMYEKLNQKGKDQGNVFANASAGDHKDPIRYQLISVVVHEGRSISSGHYVAHCRQPSGQWSTYDDEYINSISEAQVLKEPNAYYLVYTRLKFKGNTPAIVTTNAMGIKKGKRGNSPNGNVSNGGGNNKKRRRN